MFNRVVRIVLSIAVLCGAHVGARAASPQDVEEISRMVRDITIPCLSRQARMISDTSIGTTMIFIYNGRRYTIYDSGALLEADNPRSMWLTIWVAKENQRPISQATVLTDYGRDGKLDSARNMESNKSFNVDKEDLEYAALFQQEFEEVVSAALAYKRAVSNSGKK